MEELCQVLRTLDLDDAPDDSLYDYINVFKNPGGLPINQIHLEKTTLQLRKDVKLDLLLSDDFNEVKCFESRTRTIPALDKEWVPEGQPYFKFHPYNCRRQDEDQVKYFISQNRLFVQTLDYLLTCNYHQFWCSILFEPQVRVSLHSFLLNPILPHLVEEMALDAQPVYLVVLTRFLRIYERLLTFHQSKKEFMSQDVGFKYLLELKLLNLPILITLVTLYQDFNNMKFINDLVGLYFHSESVFRDREVEEMLNQVTMTLEMIGGHLCGFEEGAQIIPITIEARPPVFNLDWVYSLVNYLLNTVLSLSVLLKYHHPAVEIALKNQKLPYRLSFMYERVFYNLYDMLWNRPEVQQDPDWSKLIFQEIALARCEFIDLYNCFVTFCLDRTLEGSGDPKAQDEWVEIYLKLMTTGLEDEYFICDYHERYNVGVHNEMFTTCSNLDETRTDYILNCIKSLKRQNRIWKALKRDKKSYAKALEKYQFKKIAEIESARTPQPLNSPTSPLASKKPSDQEIEELIKYVIDMFPHLGDCFVLKCLECYNYQASEVISAILEENLPPHIMDIPMDQIRIPPEPQPEQPIMAYHGHKPGYDDALKLLNDKKDMHKIKTFILDGIQFSNEYDDYDDEYDDRLDEAPIPVPDYGADKDQLKFTNPNYEDAVSDTSYSEEEYDDKGLPASSTNRNASGTSARNDKNFCEDPAVLRARREAKRLAQGGGGGGGGKSRDVVGKPKGQGQEKSTLQSRNKKGVQKSSRANHSRKSGAQWKRNKGMIPS